MDRAIAERKHRQKQQHDPLSQSRPRLSKLHRDGNGNKPVDSGANHKSQEQHRKRSGTKQMQHTGRKRRKDYDREQPQPRESQRKHTKMETMMQSKNAAQLRGGNKT